MDAMIIVQGSFILRPEDRDGFLAQNVATVPAVREETGCLEYVFAADPTDPGRVILSERWESMEDVEEHSRAMGRRRQEAAAAGASSPLELPIGREIYVFETSSAKLL
jgi:quinol monooxygenase YgiN